MANTTTLQVVNEQDLEQPNAVKGDRFDAFIPDELQGLLKATTTPVAEKEPGGDEGKPAVAPEKKAVPAPPGVIAERRKRQAAEERATRIEAQADRLRSRNTQLEQTQIAQVGRPEARWAELAQKADAETDLKTVVRMVLDEADTRIREHLQAQEVQREKSRIVRLEKQFERENPDFKTKLQEAGIFEGIQQRVQDGRLVYVNPEMAEAIYGEENPAKAAYELAKEMLSIRARNNGHQVEPADEITRQVADPEPKREAPAKAQATTVDLDAARREGAAQITAKLAAAGDKPRGINALGSAGEPKLSLSLEDLDDLLDKNPDAYERLIAANPKLGRWHLGES